MQQEDGVEDFEFNIVAALNGNANVSKNRIFPIRTRNRQFRLYFSYIFLCITIILQVYYIEPHGIQIYR